MGARPWEFKNSRNEKQAWIHDPMPYPAKNVPSRTDVCVIFTVSMRRSGTKVNLHYLLANYIKIDSHHNQNFDNMTRVSLCSIM